MKNEVLAWIQTLSKILSWRYTSSSMTTWRVKTVRLWQRDADVSVYGAKKVHRHIKSFFECTRASCNNWKHSFKFTVKQNIAHSPWESPSGVGILGVRVQAQRTVLFIKLRFRSLTIFTKSILGIYPLLFITLSCLFFCSTSTTPNQ